MNAADSVVNALLWPKLDRHLARAQSPFVLGISGVQGSGKSTLAKALAAQAEARGLSAVTLSLDDVYLQPEERQALSERVHPLFKTRGVPGTHDVALLEHCLDALTHASPQFPAYLPRFDKGRDARFPQQTWPCLTTPPALIILEGWCLGVGPQSSEALVQPINSLEREEDVEGIWRAHINQCLARHYVPLWLRIEHLIVLNAPSFDVVIRWRNQQEEALRQCAAPQAMDAAALARFVAHFERLSRHALASLPLIADTLLQLDDERRVIASR